MTKKICMGMLLAGSVLIIGNLLFQMGDIVSHTIIKESHGVYNIKPMPPKHIPKY